MVKRPRPFHKFAMYSLPAGSAHETAVMSLPADRDNCRCSQQGNLSRIVEQVPGILWTTDLDLHITSSLGNGLGRLNPMIHPFVGMPLSEFFGDEEIHSQVLDAHHRALGGLAQSFEITVGTTVIWGTVEPLFNADWSLIGTVGMATDISNRKNAEDERARLLAQRQAAEKRQALSNLAVNITHHFASLFQSISGYAAVIAMGLPPDHPGQRWLADIDRAAQRAVDLTEEISCLDLASDCRIEPESRQMPHRQSETP